MELNKLVPETPEKKEKLHHTRISINGAKASITTF